MLVDGLLVVLEAAVRCLQGLLDTGHCFCFEIEAFEPGEVFRVAEGSKRLCRNFSLMFLFAQRLLLLI